MGDVAEQERTSDEAMGTAILRGIGIGIPVVLIGLTLGIWLITDLDLFDSLVAALLPGILLGAFGGGFAGMATTMTE